MASPSADFALDLQSTRALGRMAQQDPERGLRAASEQFEAIFMQMMLKSMRAAIPRSDLFNSQQTQFYESLMDQQWAQHLSGRGVGLAEELVKALEPGAAADSKPEDPEAWAELVERQRALADEP